GRQDQRLHAGEFGFREIGQLKAAFLRGVAAAGRIVPGQHLRAARDQGFGGRQTRPRQPHHRNCVAFEALNLDHRNFNVDRPPIARIDAIIQNRMTMVGSCQPFFSKWWCSGAIMKTRRPVSLKLATCTITDTVSSTNNPPTMTNTSSCLVTRLTAPSAPPIASEPVSPMKTMAGGALNHRKPRPAPHIAAQKIPSSPAPGT